MSQEIILSAALLKEIQTIGSVLGLSDSECVEYILENYMEAFKCDGEVERLVGLAGQLTCSTREQALSVAERLEVFATEVHLRGGEHYETLLSVEVIGSNEKGWQFKIERLEHDQWRPDIWSLPDNRKDE